MVISSNVDNRQIAARTCSCQEKSGNIPHKSEQVKICASMRNEIRPFPDVRPSFRVRNHDVLQTPAEIGDAKGDAPFLATGLFCRNDETEARGGCSDPLRGARWITRDSRAS